MSRVSRRLSALVLASMIGLVPRAAMAGPAPCEGYEEILFCGELSGDCEISAVDALMALRMSVDLQPADEAADLDNSFLVTAGDALRILRISVGNLDLLLSCGASQYSVKAESVGFYAHDGFHVANNYATGWYNAPSNDEARSYFVFDVTGIPGTVLGARIHVAASPAGQSLYKSPDPSETFKLFAVSTSLATLTNGSGGSAAFTDLGDGEEYGGFTASVATVRPLTNIPLNFAGVSYINGATGKVAFGGTITTLAKGDADEYIFNSTNVTNVRELVLSIAQ